MLIATGESNPCEPRRKKCVRRLARWVELTDVWPVQTETGARSGSSGFLALFGDGPQVYSSIGSAPASAQSGECRPTSSSRQLGPRLALGKQPPSTSKDTAIACSRTLTSSSSSSVG